MPTRRSNALTFAGLRRSSRCSTGMWRSTRSSRSAASVAASPAFGRSWSDERGDQRFGDAHVDRQSVVFEFGAQQLRGRLRVGRGQGGRRIGEPTQQFLLGHEALGGEAGPPHRPIWIGRPRTGGPLGAQVPGRIERLVRIDLPIVIGEQVGTSLRARARRTDRGREPWPRSRPATFAILRRASGAPHRDPSSGPGGSRSPRGRGACRCGHHTQRGRVVRVDAADRLGDSGPVEPASRRGFVDVDDRRADVRHDRDGDRSGHPQPSSSRRSSSIPAACATSWMTVTYTSSSNCSRSSHASHSANR